MPDVSPIGSLSTADYTNGTGSARVPTQTLGQQDFLKLLVTKMSSQDPMNPQQDTEFIAQMAQFSTLEESKTMQSDIASLRAQQEVLMANGLIGRNVTLNDGKTDVASGVVQSISMSGPNPMVVVGGKSYGLDEVSLISPPPIPVVPPATTSTGLPTA
jgi:flagellar basal-body rod modification protein FlgD